MKFNTIFLAGLLALASNLKAMNQNAEFNLHVPHLGQQVADMGALLAEIDGFIAEIDRQAVLNGVAGYRAQRGPDHGRVTPPNQGVRKGGCPKAPARKK